MDGHATRKTEKRITHRNMKTRDQRERLDETMSERNSRVGANQFHLSSDTVRKVLGS
jgi:hypothetical protein